ncbi:LOW QUALITY PROTEIN: hypothetical protein MAR_008925, partial [Mya arenaria]
RRSSSNAFEWKSQCFICGEKCDTIRDPSNNLRPGRSWSMVETSIDSSHNSTYSKVLKAAEIKNDTSLINRLRSVSNGDLVALEARYLRKKGCLTKYYDTNLKTDQINSNVAQKFRYRSAAFQLKEELYHEPKECFRFIEIAREDFGDNVETYRSFYFKILLQDVWPELTVVYQNGKSDLVCSKDVTVGEALRDYKELEQSFYDASDEDIEIDLASDESIVHKAVGVLRRRILRNTEKLDITSIQSPKHLGLTVHLYNEFGSRHLIEDMNSLGYGISYSELRMFLSSAAEHAIKTQCITETGGLVPDNITHKRDGGQLVVGVADNWDHNEKTTDGKGTTHAMTSILVSPKVSADRQIPRLQRSTNRSFDKNCVPGGSLCSITPYRKPINRPCPTFEPVVSLEEVNPTVTPAVTQSRLKELLYSFGRCSVFCDDISERRRGNVEGLCIGKTESKPKGSDPPVKGFFSPMTRSKVKTMAASKIKTQVKRTNNINSEVMFQRLLAVNAYKKSTNITRFHLRKHACSNKSI